MKKNIYIMYGTALLQGMVFYGPIATLYRQAQGVSIFQITVIESISLALGILLEIPWGLLADKIGYRKTMIICSGIYFLSKIVFWKATGFAGFLIERVMLSVVIAGFSGVDTGIIYLSCNGKDSQKALGIYNSMGMAGLLIAAGIFSVFVRDDYALSGFLTVISYGIAAILSLGLKEVAVVKQGESISLQAFWTVFQDMFHDRSFILFLIAAALLSETHQTVTVFLNQLQYERCGLESVAIGWIYIAITILGLLGGCSAAVTKRIGVWRSLLLFGGLYLAACTLLSTVPYAIPSVISIGVLRLSHTLFQPLQSEIQNRQVKTAFRATALSVYSMFISCVGIATNLVFGALSAWNLSVAFLFGSGICLLSLILFRMWYRHDRSTDKEPCVKVNDDIS